MTREQANKKAKAMLSKYTLDQLIEQWEIICTKKTTMDVVNVRGWILEALEEKEPEKMESFYDSFAQDLELRNYLK